MRRHRIGGLAVGPWRASATVDRIAARRLIDRAVVETKCAGCGAVVHRCKKREQLASPNAWRALARQAFDAHRAESGCSGTAAIARDGAA